jgi:hypothetical protein
MSNSRQLPRRATMVGPGNMAGVYRATRVGSSTCPKPAQSTADAVVGLVDFSKGSVSAQDLFMAQCAQDWSDADFQANPAIFDYFE